MKLLFALFVATLSSHSFAANILTIGGVDGGGGKGVLCTGAFGMTVESLDLFEARNVWGYNLRPAVDLQHEMQSVMPIYWSAVFEDPEQAPFKYDEKSFEFFRNMYQSDFIDQMRFIPTGTRLRPTEDATLILDPPSNCQVVQILVYLDEGTNTSGIVVDKEYWDLLDDQNRLALYIHERDYKTFRSYAQRKSSDAVRKYVGALFADVQFPSRIGALRKATSVLKCESQPTAPLNADGALFYVVPIEHPKPGDAQTLLYFDSFGIFGEKNGPVEYQARSGTTFNYFKGESGPGQYESNGTLFINSIVGGLQIKIEGKERCTDGGSLYCPVELYLSKQSDDGIKIQQRIFCKAITVIPN